MGGKSLNGERHDALEGALGTTRLLADAHRIADEREERLRVSAGTTMGKKRGMTMIERDLERIKARALDAPPEITYAEADGSRRDEPDETVYGTAERRYASVATAEAIDELFEKTSRPPARYALCGRKEGEGARRPGAKPTWWQTVRHKLSGEPRREVVVKVQDEDEDEMEQRHHELIYDPPAIIHPAAAEYQSMRPPRPPPHLTMPTPLSPSRYPQPPSSRSPRPKSNVSSTHPDEAPPPPDMSNLTYVVSPSGDPRRNSAGLGAHGRSSISSVRSLGLTTPGSDTSSTYTEWRRPKRSSPRLTPPPRGFIFEEH